MKFKIPIERTLKSLLAQEDTDGDKKITIEDNGPKSFTITSGEALCVIEGTYHLSNLLQELVIARNKGETELEITKSIIEELPTIRVSRMIRDYYWNGLTRTMGANGIERLIADTKNESLTAERLPVYVPFYDELAFDYYKKLEGELLIETVKLPKEITPEYVKSINKKPGVLSLKLEEVNGEIQAVPFVVPGGRFNEMYGWDSYFEAIGLLIDGKVHLAKGMADNFQYEIKHYGKILNANRSYYLTRTQPPFYTSLIREVYEVTKDKAWLKSHLKTAIKEYETVWMVEGKRETRNGLNRYLAEGIGIPPECEEGHFDAVMIPCAEKLGLTMNEYERKYVNGEVSNHYLDTYFIHDRSVRESGHDTSYRIDGNCADLNLVELNAFLYKYETDFAELISEEFNNSFEGMTSDFWEEKAHNRKELINTYLWNGEANCYFDYNWITYEQVPFVSATSLIPLWCNLASEEQAQALVKNILPLLLENGGIAGCTKESRGEISKERPQRQWDYPNGWAPHQMMIWKGLLNYGFKDEAQEVIYRWLYMITKNAVDYNGTIPEKYDVVEATHKVFAEYGNVGVDFEYITSEGFGWMNASYQYGISLLSAALLERLNNLDSPEKVF
ncbi:alpha,alpha-trehalase [Tenacibaculum sp. MAR_2009_124]|uniref:alpha,alpha-trehalase n=1 Tax=Tenacibaculum sp. MAR_2009_124 TaxID=1250059 RepID=UPI0008995BDF|nr:alpha,alpha-trehalase [Tenacibaculum sp. MAR_2009_124]SEC19273.1 alpha,alpha-trehalase [Tenacibaculum sp. MAR_2009_124]